MPESVCGFRIAAKVRNAGCNRSIIELCPRSAMGRDVCAEKRLYSVLVDSRVARSRVFGG